MSTDDMLGWAVVILGAVSALQWYEIRKLRRRVESVNATMWALQLATQGVLSAEEASSLGAQATPPEAMRRLTGPRIVEQTRKLQTGHREREQRVPERAGEPRAAGAEFNGDVSSRAHRPPGWS